MGRDQIGPEDLIARLNTYYADVDGRFVVIPPWKTSPQASRLRRLTWGSRVGIAAAAVCVVGVGGAALESTVLRGPNIVREHVGSLMLLEDVSAAPAPPRVSQSQAETTALGQSPKGYHISSIFYVSGLLSATGPNGLEVSEFGRPVAVWVVELAGTMPGLNAVAIIDGATGRALSGAGVTRVVPPSPTPR